MNKLVVSLLALVAISPVVAMMDCIQITEQENNNFARHLAMAVGFGKQMVAEEKIPKENPIHVMLTKLSDDLTTFHGDLSKMIRCQDLEDRIERFSDVAESDMHVRFAKLQIFVGGGDRKEVEKYLTRARQTVSGLILEELHPTYAMAWIGEVQTQDRIKFMIRNNAYPLDEEAKKDYIAFFIYQLLFASRIPENELGTISPDMLKEQGNS